MYKKLVCGLLCLLAFLPAWTQPIDWQKRLPADPNVTVGKLPNGITYYLRHNEEPKERASFFIIRNAGALLENDDQDGLAHFLEHMAFNGSKNFPGNSMISTLERHGVSFGRNLNAYTTQNETVYNISDVPVNDGTVIDTCLLILHDWSYYLTLDDKDIDEERGVITEEWRTRNTSRSRIHNQQTAVIFKGSQYAERDVIGDLNVIKSFKPQTIRDFYHQWYRTDLEAIVVVGDFDVKVMEEKIKKTFSGIPAVKNPTVRPFFEIPSHDDLYFGLATDKESTQSSVDVIRVFRAPQYDYKGYMTYQGLKEQFIQRFFNEMAGERINELLQSGKAPFLRANIAFFNIARGYYAYDISADAKPNGEKEALEAILREHERIRQHGFTNAELERAKTNTIASLKSFLKEKDKISNDEYADDMQSHFLENEPMVSEEVFVEAALQIIPTITTDEISQRVAEWWKADNRSILVSGPSEGVTHLTEAEAVAILNNAENEKVEAYEDNTVGGSLVKDSLTLAPITKIRMLKDFNAEEWTLANGAKVVFRHADFEKDQVALAAFSPGGLSLIDDTDMLPAASNAGIFAGAYGMGDFDHITLNKLLTGKIADCQVSVGSLYESVNGAAAPQDAETMMQMLYLRFCEPRFDTLAHRVLVDRNRIFVQQQAGLPQKIMQDSIVMITSDYNPRTQLFNEAYIDKLTIDRIEKVYKDRIADASDFTFFIVGNLSKDSAQILAQRYIGNIPSAHRKEKWIDRGVRGPEGITEKRIGLDLTTPKSTVIAMLETESKYTVKNSYLADILGQILMTRYTRTIREEEGGTYGVGVSGTASSEPYPCYKLTMSFDCDPSKADELKPLLYKELDQIAENGVTEEELDKVIKNALKEHEQEKAHNSYWLNTLVSYYKTGTNYDAYKNCEGILKSITPKDIQKFTRSFWKKADRLEMIFYPNEKKDSQK